MAKGNRALKIVTCTLIKGARGEQARGVRRGCRWRNLCHSKCLRTLRRQIIIVARRFDADCMLTADCQICLRKSCGLGSAESCGFKSQKKPFQIVYFDASYVAHSQLSTLGSQIRATYARGDLVLNRLQLLGSSRCPEPLATLWQKAPAD
jgi:hypothetical protein